MKILAIETSCDETSLAIVEASGGLKSPKFRVIKNLVASQIKIHRPFGGVVPNLAKREHIKNLPLLWQRILNMESGIWNKNKKALSPNSPATASKNSMTAGSRKGRDKFQILNSIDLIAVTVGPGLEPALWTGINFAKELWQKMKHETRNIKPEIIGVNHMEGHLYSFLLPKKTVNPKSEFRNSKKVSDFVLRASIFPAIALLVSGGHTILLKMESFSKWKKLGETRDDATGEAFDKVARLLGLPYPGGPEIEKLARKGNPQAINFPRPMMHDKNYDFSFSGLKTSVLYYLRDNPGNNKKDVAASFQEAAIDVLVAKTIRAAKEFGAKSIMLSGGVAANKALRKELKAKSSRLKANFYVADFKYNLDNAAMIAAAGYFTYLRKSSRGGSASGGKKYPLEARGDLEI